MRYPVQEGVEPLTVVHWRTISGPLPLSLDIVGVVTRQEGDIREAIKEVTINNALKKEKALEEAAEAFAEELDWIKRSSRRLGLYTGGKPKHDSV